jgi:hypothetical protein
MRTEIAFLGDFLCGVQVLGDQIIEYTGADPEFQVRV